MWDIYKSGSLKMVLKELAKCRLDLVGPIKVSWDKGGTD